jgi:hypothetical protein
MKNFCSAQKFQKNLFINKAIIGIYKFMYSPASDVRCDDIPRLISCFPIFDCGCSILFCENNWVLVVFVSLLLLSLDEFFFSSFNSVKSCGGVWLFGCCCCCLLLQLFRFFSVEDLDLQFRRNLVRMLRNDGCDGYYRPPMRTHPRLLSLLLYHTPVSKVDIRKRNK